MPTSFSGKRPLAAAALALLVVAACAAAPATQASAPPAQSIVVPTAGGPVTVPVSVDAALVDPAGEHEVEVLGARGQLLLVLDSYGSRPQSMSRCQAGQERYVRLIDARARAERFSKLAESCLRDVVPGDPVASWTGDGAFRVNLLSEAPVVGTVDAAGKVSLNR